MTVIIRKENRPIFLMKEDFKIVNMLLTNKK